MGILYLKQEGNLWLNHMFPYKQCMGKKLRCNILYCKMRSTILTESWSNILRRIYWEVLVLTSVFSVIGFYHLREYTYSETDIWVTFPGTSANLLLYNFWYFLKKVFVSLKNIDDINNCRTVFSILDKCNKLNFLKTRLVHFVLIVRGWGERMWK